MAYHDPLNLGSANNVSPVSRWQRLLLPFFSIVLIVTAACGTSFVNSDSDTAAQSSAVVEGNTLTWSPPWEAGDARKVTVESSSELSPEAQAMLEAWNESDEDAFPGGMFGMHGTMPLSGTVRFVETGQNGDIAEYEISFEDLLAQMTPDDLSDDDSSQLRMMLAFVSQLDLALQFNVGPDGAITEVTNLDEIAQQVRGFASSIIAMAGAQNETGGITPEDQAKIETVLEELPKIDFARQMALAAAYGATGHLFLMREGEYTMGEPVTVTGQVPSVVGIMAPGEAVYELTEVSDTQATIKVQVEPQQVDLYAALTDFMAQAKEMFGEDAAGIGEEMPQIGPEERQAFDAMSAMLFQPYTVTLTMDTTTGWVTGAEWDATFTVPEEMAQMEDAPEGAEDASVTLNFHSTISAANSEQ